jgi:hypothetical protein
MGSAFYRPGCGGGKMCQSLKKLNDREFVDQGRAGTVRFRTTTVGKSDGGPSMKNVKKGMAEGCRFAIVNLVFYIV